NAAWSPAISPCTPILFRLAPHCWRRRVINLEPVVDSSGAVRRTAPLRHDALTAERAVVLVDGRPGAVLVLIEGDALNGEAQKRAEQDGMIVPSVTKEVERP